MKEKLIEEDFKNTGDIKFETSEKQEEKFWILLRRFNKKEDKIIDAG